MAGEAAAGVPKRITVAILGDPASLYTGINPAAGTRGQEIVGDTVNAALSVPNDRSALIPHLAEAVPSVENGRWQIFPDGRMETSWTIRPGALWHDGMPITSNDLLFTVGLYRDKDLVDFYRITWDAIESASAPDPRTLVVTWKRPYISADELVGARSVVPSHVLQKPYAEDKATFMQLPFWSTIEYVGAGPYKPREWVRTSYLIFDAFDQFTLGRPKIDVIEARIIPDPNTLMANLLAGGIDASIGKTLSFEQAFEVRNLWPDGHVDISPAAGIAIYPQLLRPDPPVIGEVTFRRALLLAMDRQQMMETFLGGVSQVHESLVPPNNPFYPDVESSIVRYAYDPRQAVQLIEGLGYSRGPDSMFRDASGQRLQVELRTVTVDLNQKAILAVQDYLQRAGVVVETVVIPPQRAADLQYRAAYPGLELNRSGFDIEGLPALHSSNIATAATNWRGGTRTFYRNAEFDSLIERYLVSVARSDRVRVLRETVFHLTDRAIHLGMFYDVNPTAISNRLVNAAALYQQTATWNIYEWDIR